MSKTLLDCDPTHRAPLAEMLETLITRHGQSPRLLFLHALESRTEAEMTYWIIRELIETYHLPAQAPIGEDAQGRPVKPIHAAIALDNAGALAALLDARAYEGGMGDRDIQLAIRMARSQDKPRLAALIMRHAEECDGLGSLLKGLSPDALH